MSCSGGKRRFPRLSMDHGCAQRNLQSSISVYSKSIQGTDTGKQIEAFDRVELL